jgi:predicted solute-binding protein
MAEIDRIVPEAAAELALPAAEIREYLTASLGFRLGNDELAGLDEYFRRAEAHGLIERAGPIALVDAGRRPR